ncbi:protein phosphatase 2C domain-containing protein [Streptacidiphilus sp. 4-A2]|nr:protein phosphatase 2C domain-containing protein [Streptacidiphilus sp. 4-A2]
MPLEIRHATEPTPGGVNEDLVIAGPNFAFVLDGATATGAPTGCIHDVAWYVGELATHLTGPLLTSKASLVDILHASIGDLTAAHARTCDVTNPDSPSSTVAIVRVADGQLEALSLADSPVVVERHDGEILVIVDDRTSHLASYTIDAVRAYRNSDNGFWVASTKPEAAHKSVCATLPLDEVKRFAVFSDGGSRLADRYDWPWLRVLSEMEEFGPSHIIAETRTAERATVAGRFRGKPHDDSTAVLCLPRDLVTAP